MAKTSSTSPRRRRQRRPNVPPYIGPIDPAAGAQTEAADPSSSAAAPPSVPLGSRRTRPVPVAPAAAIDFRKEYSYVLKDLRNMGIVAAAMVVLLLALNFVVA